MRSRSSPHTTAGSLVQPIVFSTNQKVACLPTTKYNWLNTKCNSDGCHVTDKRRGPVLQPFVGRRMLNAIPKRLKIEPRLQADDLFSSGKRITYSATQKYARQCEELTPIEYFYGLSIFGVIKSVGRFPFGTSTVIIK